MVQRHCLTDDQWELVADLVEAEPKPTGRPPKDRSYCQELCFEDGLSGDLLDSIDELLSLEKEGDLLVTVETTPTLLS